MSRIRLVLLRDIRVLFEVAAASSEKVIRFSIARASDLCYDLETVLSKIAQHHAFAPVKARECGKVMKSRRVRLARGFPRARFPYSTLVILYTDTGIARPR